MKNYYKKFALALFAAGLMIGAPYIKTPCDCGANLPLIFPGAILGCSGEKDSTSSDNSSNQTVAVEKANQNEVDVKSTEKTEIKVTFVELGSVNCVPCRMMEPVLEEVKKKYAGQVKVLFYDVWTPEGREEGYKYNIRVIPTQVFLDKDGKEYFRHEGFFPFEEVDKILKQKGVK